MHRLSEPSHTLLEIRNLTDRERKALQPCLNSISGRGSSKKIRGELVWDAPTEAVLIQALYVYRPQTSTSGLRFPYRNDFIAKYIEEHTGNREINAKKVGSRIQQLRVTCTDAGLKYLLDRKHYPAPIPGNEPRISMVSRLLSGKCISHEIGEVWMHREYCCGHIRDISSPPPSSLSIDRKASAVQAAALAEASLTPYAQVACGPAHTPFDSLYQERKMIYDDGHAYLRITVNVTAPLPREDNVFCFDSPVPLAPENHYCAFTIYKYSHPGYVHRYLTHMSLSSSEPQRYIALFQASGWHSLASIEIADLKNYTLVQEVMHSPTHISRYSLNNKSDKDTVVLKKVYQFHRDCPSHTVNSNATSDRYCLYSSAPMAQAYAHNSVLHSTSNGLMPHSFTDNELGYYSTDSVTNHSQTQQQFNFNSSYPSSFVPSPSYYGEQASPYYY